MQKKDLWVNAGEDLKQMLLAFIVWRSYIKVYGIYLYTRYKTKCSLKEIQLKKKSNRGHGIHDSRLILAYRTRQIQW